MQCTKIQTNKSSILRCKPFTIAWRMKLCAYELTSLCVSFDWKLRKQQIHALIFEIQTPNIFVGKQKNCRFRVFMQVQDVVSIGTCLIAGVHFFKRTQTCPYFVVLEFFSCGHSRPWKCDNWMRWSLDILEGVVILFDQWPHFGWRGWSTISMKCRRTIWTRIGHKTADLRHAGQKKSNGMGAHTNYQFLRI